MEEVHTLKDALQAVKRNDLFIGFTSYITAFAGLSLAYLFNPNYISNNVMPIFAKATEVFIPALIIVHIGVLKYLAHLENLEAKG